MGFGLKVTEPILEHDKKDWVEYEGVYYPKRTVAALKAHKTRKQNAQKKLYGNRPKKNKTINLIKKHIENEDKYHNIIFSLETSEYNLPNILDKERTSFYIAQNDKKEYDKMLKNKPKNVEFLHYGCVSELQYLSVKPDYIFFDFCKTFSKCTKIFEKLNTKINDCYKVFLTVCLRKMNKEIDDYKFDFANKLHRYFSGFDILEAVPYQDKNHSPMIFFVLVNLHYCSLDIHDRYSHTAIYEHRLLLWVKEQIKKDYQEIYDLLEKEQYNRLWCLECKEAESVKIDKMLQVLFNKAIEEEELILPFYNTNHERLIAHRIDCLCDYFSYFRNLVVHNLSGI